MPPFPGPPLRLSSAHRSQRSRSGSTRRFSRSSASGAKTGSSASSSAANRMPATCLSAGQAGSILPPALRFRLGSDGNLSSARTEPIAADARPGKDGKNNAKLKLISGLLGVGYDALRRREQQRRNARLFAFSCATAAGMVLTSGLAAYALVQRAAAQRQTLRAEAEARTSKEATRFLVDLFRIFDPSEARGSTVTAREMLDKG